MAKKKVLFHQGNVGVNKCAMVKLIELDYELHPRSPNWQPLRIMVEVSLDPE